MKSKEEMIKEFIGWLGSVGGFLTGFILVELIVYKTTGDNVLTILQQLLTQHQK